MSNQDDVPIVNGWTEEIQSTVKKWKSDIDESSFIYGEKLEDLEKNMDFVVISSVCTNAGIALVLAISSSLVATSSISKWVVFGIQVLVSLAALIVTVSNEISEKLEFRTKIKEITKYIAKLDSQSAVYDTELTIPIEERQNGSDFLKREDGNYTFLLKEGPHLSAKDYFSYKQRYLNRMKEHYKWQKQFDEEMEQLV